ncbi:hypothetical protein [Vibrio phage vB_VpaP_SJSY21]|nr:hypothetical protein [Vibrio phage vB_VpaP_SJSY21]
MVKFYLIGFVLNLLYMAYVCLYKNKDDWESNMVKKYSPNVTTLAVMVLAIFYPLYYLFVLVRKVFVRK